MQIEGLTKFQFQYGAIKGGGFDLAAQWMGVSIPAPQSGTSYGAIKGNIMARSIEEIYEFQFQYGAIKGSLLNSLSACSK